MTGDTSVTFAVTEHERDMLRAAADAQFNGSVAELVRDALRMYGFRIKARADMRPAKGRRQNNGRF